MTNIKRPEVLPNLQDLEKLKRRFSMVDAVLYQCQGLYLVAVQETLPWNRWEEGVQFAAKYGAILHVWLPTCICTKLK